MIFGLQYTQHCTDVWVPLYPHHLWWLEKKIRRTCFDTGLKLETTVLQFEQVFLFHLSFHVTFLTFATDVKRKKKKKEIWKDARCWFYPGEGSQKYRIKYSLSQGQTYEDQTVVNNCLSTSGHHRIIKTVLRQWHLFIAGTFCQDCSV